MSIPLRGNSIIQQHNLSTPLVTIISPSIQKPITTRITSFSWATQSNISKTPDVIGQTWSRTNETPKTVHTTSAQKLPKSATNLQFYLVNRKSPKPFVSTTIKPRHPHIVQIYPQVKISSLPSTSVKSNSTMSAVFLTSKFSNTIMSTLHDFIWHLKQFHFVTKEFIHQHFQFLNISCVT